MASLRGPTVRSSCTLISARCISDDDMDQTSQAKANEGGTATNGGDTDETPANSYALTTYDDDQQPVPLASLPPSSPAGGAAFVPFPASLHADSSAPYPATVIAPPLLNPHEMAFQQQQHYRQEEQLRAFWAGQLAEAEQEAAAGGESKTKAHQHSLPLARIKKIMRADRDVNMIAAEAPAVFARACEMFILELTLRAWLKGEGGGGAWRRTTLQRGDVVAAIRGTEAYDFLADVVPEVDRSGTPAAGATTTGVPVTVLPRASYSLAPVTSLDPFATYANMQQQQQQQQNFDGGRDQQE